MLFCTKICHSTLKTFYNIGSNRSAILSKNRNFVKTTSTTTTTTTTATTTTTTTTTTEATTTSFSVEAFTVTLVEIVKTTDDDDDIGTSGAGDALQVNENPDPDNETTTVGSESLTTPVLQATTEASMSITTTPTTSVPNENLLTSLPSSRDDVTATTTTIQEVETAYTEIPETETSPETDISDESYALSPTDAPILQHAEDDGAIAGLFEDVEEEEEEDGTSTLKTTIETTLKPVLEPVLDTVLETTLSTDLSPAEYIANAVEDDFGFHVKIIILIQLIFRPLVSCKFFVWPLLLFS